MSPKVIRYGILCDGLTLESWQARCLEELAAAARAQLLIIAWDPSRVKSGGPADRRPDLRQLPEKPCAERLRVDLVGAVGPLPSVTLPAAQVRPLSTAAGRAQADALAHIRSFGLDFVLNFVEDSCPPEILGVARYGVWQIRIGDWTRDHAGPGGFWEVYDSTPVSTVRLVCLQADPDAAFVLREAHLRTALLSHARNEAQLLARSIRWPAQVCNDIRNGVTSRWHGRPLRGAVSPRSWPNRWHILSYRCRIIARFARFAFRSLFRHDQWNIGIVDQPIASFLQPTQRMQVRWLSPPKRSELRADPFGLMRDGKLTILCEHFSYRDNRGFIVALEPAHCAASQRIQLGPDSPVHLSYPYLFEDQGRLLCMPESSAAAEVACYEVGPLCDPWTRLAVPLKDVAIVDASVFRHGDYWWLAGSEVAPKGANCELHLWYAESLRGPWQPHAANPVKIDVRSARPAGTLFLDNGKLYRPAQDCSSTYGARVTINQIVTLTPTEFQEDAITTVDPDPAGPYPDGLHTLSQVGNMTLIDGKRSTFAPAECRRFLAHLLRHASWR